MKKANSQVLFISFLVCILILIIGNPLFGRTAKNIQAPKLRVEDNIELNIEKLASGFIRLSWTAIGEAESYTIYQSLDPESETWTVLADEIPGSSESYELMPVSDKMFYKISYHSPDSFITMGDFVFIPPGPYAMGIDGTGFLDHGYFISKYNVTNAQYLSYLETALQDNQIWISSNDVYGYSSGSNMLYRLGTVGVGKTGRIGWNGSNFFLNVPSGFQPADFMDHPVVHVTWFGAWHYANYNGYRLPTEEEWEKAARGDNHHNFSFGNVIGPTRANYRLSGDPWEEGTTPVGYYNGINPGTVDSPSPYGIYDMTGNVADWTDGFFSEFGYYRVLRGGYFTLDSYQHFLKVYSRDTYTIPSASQNIYGFRCAKTPDPFYWEENFDDTPVGQIPENWNRMNSQWSVTETNHAGSISPELRFSGTGAGSGTHRVRTIRLDNRMAGKPLRLRFRHSLSLASLPANVTLKVQSSLGGNTWRDVWTLENPSADISAELARVSLVHLAGARFYLAWVVEGDAQELNNWCIDNIIVDEAPEEAIFSLEPVTSHDFGSLLIRNQSASQRFSVRNDGLQYLTINSLNLSDNVNYSIQNATHTLPLGLAFNETFSFDVVFAPQSIGTKPCNATIYYVIDGQQSRIVSLTGIGYDREPGSICKKPYDIRLPLSNFAGNTELMGNDYQPTWISPQSTYLGGNEMVLRFKLIYSQNLLSGSMLSLGGSNIGIFIVQSPPNPVNPPTVLHQIVSTDNMLNFTGWTLPAGTYYMILSSAATNPHYEYLLNVDLSTNSEELRITNGGTFHNGTEDVTVETFYIGRYEVTQEHYDYIMGYNPSYWQKNPQNPVDYVNWFMAIEYCNRRSMLESWVDPCYSYSEGGINYGTDPSNWPAGWNQVAANQANISCDWNANGYRLPTEMEWLYAARGGVLYTPTTYAGSNIINDVAWYWGNAGEGLVDPLHPNWGTNIIGTKNPNELGLYDMSGNVWEWCWDSWDTNAKVLKGGACSSWSEDCEILYRRGWNAFSVVGNSDVGIRVVRRITE